MDHYPSFFFNSKYKGVISRNLEEENRWEETYFRTKVLWRSGKQVNKELAKDKKFEGYSNEIALRAKS